MSNFAGSVTVVTGHTEGWYHGLTVSAFTSVSLDPPLVLICVDHSSQSIKALRAAEGFTVNMFREGTGQVALRFASKATDKLAGLVVEQPKHEAAGLCLPEESYASLECRTVESVEAGDHTIFIGHVEHANLYALARPSSTGSGDFAGSWSSRNTGSGSPALVLIRGVSEAAPRPAVGYPIPPQPIRPGREPLAG